MAALIRDHRVSKNGGPKMDPSTLRFLLIETRKKGSLPLGEPPSRSVPAPSNYPQLSSKYHQIRTIRLQSRVVGRVEAQT